MEMLQVTPENLDQEHICCAISSNKDPQVLSKKNWLRGRFEDGLVFLRSTQRGKCFIEYIPAEKAWVPIQAGGYLHIDCLWVSGSLKGHGYSTELLEACIRDAKAQGKLGLTILSSPKKLGFLADPKFLSYKGFRVADTAEPYFTLMYLPFAEDVPVPQFLPQAKHPHTEGKGYQIFYTAQCPFTAKYVPLLQKIAEEHGVPMEVIHLDSTEKAQAAPSAFTTFILFRDGEFVTHEILSEKKFLQLIDQGGA